MGNRSPEARLYPAMIAAVSGAYLLVTLPALSTLPHYVTAGIGTIVLGHGLLLFGGIGKGSVSAVPMLGYGTFLFLTAVWRGGLQQPWQGLDTGAFALALLLLWSGVVMLHSEESNWWLP